MAERPNRTLATMVRCMTHAAGLGPEYWSWALLHAVYVKNRLPHRATATTPFLAYRSKKPSAKLLRVWGCRVIVKLPGPRPAKLDHHTTTGTFLGYTATDHNIYYRDTVTKRIKVATHVTFDEAGMTLPPAERPPYAITLQQAGYIEHPQDHVHDKADPIVNDISDNALKVKLLTPQAKLPTRASDNAAGYDLYSATKTTIPPHSRVRVPTDITIKPPPHTYGHILSRSGLATKSLIDVAAGTIDADYTGNIQVVFHNASDSAFSIDIGDCIAQLVLYYIASPGISIVTKLEATSRADQGFGSTGVTDITPTARAITTAEPPPLTSSYGPDSDDDEEDESDEDADAAQSPADVTTPQIQTLTDDFTSPLNAPSTANREPTLVDIVKHFEEADGIKPYDIWMSRDPFDLQLTIQLPVRGEHPTLGLILHERIQSIDDVTRIVARAKRERKFNIKCIFATESL